MLRSLPFLLCWLYGASLTCAQSTPCPAELGSLYEGPCYYGALPAFFDDFEYDTARTTGSLTHAPDGDLFGANEWYERHGTTTTRAWYRFNRNDHDIPGTITFEEPSVMAMRLPAGLAASGYMRSPALQTDFTAGPGTYVWRVRLSELGKGQQVRQSVWTMSHNSYVFDRPSPEGTERFSFWSELDFENENYFQGERPDGTFIPDFVTRMSVGNHYGKAEDRHGSHRLGTNGRRQWSEGSGTLARNGPGRGAATEAPLLSSWAGTWLYLVADVDQTSRTVTYRMVPETPGTDLQALTSRVVTVGPDFYPREPMHLSFSLHWVEPKGTLLRPLYLDVDWAYMAPIAGLPLEIVREQVSHLRRHELPRLNTTGQTTFNGFDTAKPLGLELAGPRHAVCGEEARWDVHVARIGRYHVTMRYRILPTDGPPGAWKGSFTPTLIVTPRRGQRGIELEATAQDEWAPHGTIAGPNRRPVPNPANDADRVRLTARFDCAP